MNIDAEIQKVINAADTSVWLRQALQAAVERDPADAANDAEYLSELLARRFNAIVKVPGVPEFNGRPLVDELRRLAQKNPGDCDVVMNLAADALESGVQPMFGGLTLEQALRRNLRNAMGDSKAAIHAAIDTLSWSR